MITNRKGVVVRRGLKEAWRKGAPPIASSTAESPCTRKERNLSRCLPEPRTLLMRGEFHDEAPTSARTHWIRRKCSDHAIVLNEARPRRVLKSHFEYYD